MENKQEWRMILNCQKRKLCELLKMENISHGFEKLLQMIKPKKENEKSTNGISFLGNRFSKNQKKLIKNKKIPFWDFF